MVAIQQETKLHEDLIISSVKSLSHQEHPLLAKIGNGEISMADKLMVNEEFKSKHKRLNINKIHKEDRKAKEENKNTEEKVKEDRKY